MHCNRDVLRGSSIHRLPVSHFGHGKIASRHGTRWEVQVGTVAFRVVVTAL